jgi:hypothetical protein
MGMPFWGVCGRDSGNEGDCIFEDGASVIGSGDWNNTLSAILEYGHCYYRVSSESGALMSFRLKIE